MFHDIIITSAMMLMRKENNEKSNAKEFWKNTIESLIFVGNRISSLLKLFR
jgi:hypothetical protein